MTRFDNRLRRGRSRAATALGLGTVALVASLMVSGSAQAVTPATIDLGTAAPFAVLAGSGITNTLTTTIVGDVGSSPTATEDGFETVTLTSGTNYAADDPVTQGAKIALTAAYTNALNRLTPTTVVTDLGAQTLVAGVYHADSGTFGLTGTLTLDGANNADSVFIFQATSTLITDASTSINLINGAQSCNVFWQVGSSATLGASSTFRGTILAAESITAGTGATVDGRLLASTAHVTLHGNTITKPATCVTQASIDSAAADKAAADKAAADKAAAATAAATAAAQAEAAAAAQAAVDAKAAAAQAAAAAKAADVKAAAAAAAKAAAAAQAATKAAALAATNAKAAAVKAADVKAVALAAKVKAAKAAAAKAAKAARVAKAAAAKAAKATVVAKKIAAVKPAQVTAGFTG